MSAVTVDEVGGGKDLARFVELPHALHGGDPRFAPLVLSWERYRLDPRRNPFFDRGDGRYFLARRLGRPVGRVTAHVAEPGGEGWFGFWWVDEDTAAAAALLDAARSWLAEQGCTSMTGPVSFTGAEERGIQVVGHELPGVTGRPWHPPHLAALLVREGLEEVDRHGWWRLLLDASPPADATATTASGDRPGHAGSHLDPRLVLPTIAAVPDLSSALADARLRALRSIVQRARARAWTTCTVVRWETDRLAADVGALRSVAASAGYRVLVSPHGPHGVAPDLEYAVFRRTWT